MHPVLFYLGSWPVHSYGVMFALAILAGTGLSWYLAKRKGKFSDEVLDIVFYIAIAGILGARLWQVAFTWEYYADEPWTALAVWEGGLSVQGGVMGALIALIWYTKRRGLPFWEFADLLAPGMLLGQAIGRVGCFLNGCCYGIPANSRLGVIYPPGSDAYNTYGSQPLYPTVLFEAGWDLLIMGILLYYSIRKPFHGFLTTAYFILYSLGRFFLEFIRAGDLRIIYNLKVAQVASILAILLAGVVMFSLYLHSRYLGQLNEKIQ